MGRSDSGKSDNAMTKMRSFVAGGRRDIAGSGNGRDDKSMRTDAMEVANESVEPGRTGAKRGLKTITRDLALKQLRLRKS